MLRIGLDIGAYTVKGAVVPADGAIRELPILPVQGQPLRRCREMLAAAQEQAGAQHSDVLLGITGTGANALCQLLGIRPVDEPTALAAAFSRLNPQVRTVVEMGKQSQKYLLFGCDDGTGRLLLEDSSLGNKCAAGSGSFLDHMVKRLNFPSIEALAQIAYETPNPASLSGRCAVFTESDIVHLYQKGTPRERIAAGVHQAICRNYRSSFARGKEFRPVVAFVGGVSRNRAVRKYLAEQIDLDEEAILVPEHNLTMGAIGAALKAEEPVDVARAIALLDERLSVVFEYLGAQPLALVKSRALSPPEHGPLMQEIELAALGVDIGSVSTKAALITEVDGRVVVLASYYRRTDGDPLAAVRDTVSRIHQQVKENGYRIRQVVAATTGSGRYLTGDYVGADLVKNEITAQATGAHAFLHGIDSIFEIGGQDSKYVRLSGDVITDFEMNKACAAGCGAFLEKQAANLGIPLEQFGDVALSAQRPPDLDWTCTVFSESAMVHYQHNNVLTAELAAGSCLAAAKNYLHKNVGTRDIGERVAFQGAVAFNKGMVAAFETILGREIVVPPYPHLTGAIGAALLASRARLERSRFVGFEKIAESKYRVRSFECPKCPDRCDVNIFQMEGGPRYFYNDRCEMFSAAHKRNLGAHLPDLFGERERMLFEAYTKKAPAGAPRVGMPRGLMFNEYFPLFNAFFTELGFEVVPSEPTTKRTVELGLGTALGEPCFPFKVAHGHVAELIEKGVDCIFMPAVLNTEQPNADFRQSYTCPYLQAAPEVIGSALNVSEKPVTYLTPRLFFKRGIRHLRRVFGNLAVQLGKTRKEGWKALSVGLDAVAQFSRRVDERGKEIYANLPDDQMAFVVVGRPYTLYDSAVNMDIGKKIQDLGILAIPMDFLPIQEQEVSDTWPNAYSRQVQKKLMAARLIRQDPRLRAVVLTYFACGPDSFGNPFFKDELGQPCYVMQIDEHTADAGVITRIEAFADTARAESGIERAETIRSCESPLAALDGRVLWIPYACEAAHILAAALRTYGVNAQVLARSLDPGLNLARRVISEDVCLPALMTTEDMLQRAHHPDFDAKREAFFQGSSEGPCRFGMYHMLQRRILDSLLLEEVPIVTLGSRSHHGGLGTFFSLVAWDGFVCHDLLLKMLLHTRPYDKVPGESDKAFLRFVQEVCDLLPEHRQKVESGRQLYPGLRGAHLEVLQDLLRRAQAEFGAIRVDQRPRPLVGLVGEFYVRIHDGANQDVIRKLEDLGTEVWLAPMTEFFAYSNRIGNMLSFERWRETWLTKDLREAISRNINHRLAIRDEHLLWEAALPYLAEFPDIGPDEVIGEGSRWVHPTFGGEAICSMGKAEDFAKRGVDGVVSVVPFNCMPGVTVAALSHAFRRRHGNLPFLSIDYDGFIDSTRDAKVASFAAQVRERFTSRKSD